MSSSPAPELISIADVDALITSGDVPQAATAKLNPFELLFLEQSEMYRHLLHMKLLYRTSSDVDEQYKERRNIHLQDAQNPSLLHLWNYEKAFMEINRHSDGCFGGGRVRSFLDLGCSPGGFSNWLMKTNREALGTGITLADEEAKFTMPRELFNYGSRYRVIFDNIITLVMRSVAKDENPVVQLHEADDGDDHAEAYPYDLIIVGAFPTLEGNLPWWLRVQLVLSQVLIMLSNLARGGACVITVNTKGFLWLVDVIALLNQLFETVSAVKAGKLHARRSSCYLVCRGFCATQEELELYSHRLRVALKQLSPMSAASRLEGQEVNTKLGVDVGPVKIENPESLPLIFGEDEVHLMKTGIDKIVLSLFEPLWCIQYNAIRSDFSQILKKVHADAEADGQIPDETTLPGSPSSPPSPSSWRPRRPSISISAFPTSPTSDGFSPFLDRNGPGSPSTPLSGSPPHAPPSTPYVPKWRPPQCRMSTTGNRTDTREWRKPTEDNRLDMEPSSQTAPSRPDLFGRKRGYSVSTSATSVSSANSAADASGWWRK